MNGGEAMGIFEDWTCEFGVNLSRSSGECKREGGETEARLVGEGISDVN